MVVEYEIVERENKNVDIKYIENSWILKDLPKDTRMIFFTHVLAHTIYRINLLSSFI